MIRRSSSFAIPALALLVLSARASAQDLPSRLAAVRDAAAATALNSSHPTQLNITSDRNGQPKMVATLLAYGGGGNFVGGTEAVLEGDLVALPESPRDPAQAREFRAGLVRNPVVSDVGNSASLPGVRIAISGLTIDTIAKSAGGSDITAAVAPGLETSLSSENYGLSSEDERVHLLLAHTLRAALDSGASAEGIIYRDGANYRMLLTAGAGSAALSLSSVTSINGVPQAGRVDVTASSLAGDACFAPVLPIGTSRTTEGTCLPLSAGANAQLDLAELAGTATAGPCVENDATGTYCMYDNDRFEIKVVMNDFNNPPTQYLGRAILNGQGQSSRGSKPGFEWLLLYTFDNTNPEVMVKFLNACGLNDKIWVFGAQSTNAYSRIDIRDTVTGATKTYTNTAGVTASAIADTNAFDCQ